MHAMSELLHSESNVVCRISLILKTVVFFENYHNESNITGIKGVRPMSPNNFTRHMNLARAN